MEPTADAQLFRQLSQILTGFDDLDADLAQQYLDRLAAQFPKETAALLAAFRKIVAQSAPADPRFVTADVKRSVLVTDAKNAVLVQKIITLWYTAQFPGPDGKALPAATEQQYLSALLWPAIHAHAPTRPNEPPGAWHHAPTPSPREQTVTIAPPGAPEKKPAKPAPAPSENAVYDVVIVGAGVAGAIAAWKLSEAKHKVLLIESGESRLDPSHRDAFVAKFRQTAYKDQTPSLPYQSAGARANAPIPDNDDFSTCWPDPANPQKKATPYYVQTGPDAPFKSQYMRLPGGSTWTWRGNAIRLLPGDFKLKTLYGRGVDWPIEYADLEAWYCEAERELGVSGDHKEWDGLQGAQRSQPFPMPKIPQAYGDVQVMTRLPKDFKVDGTSVRIVSTPQARNSVPYQGRSQCLGNSSCIPVCPSQAKYDAAIHVRRALEHGCTLMDKCVVTGVDLDRSGRVSGVTYKRWDEPKTERKVAGRIVVLAAHAIETAKILLMSDHRRGIANSSDQVGRNLMDHLGGEGGAVMPFAVFPFRGPQTTSGIDDFRDGAFRAQRSSFRLSIGNDGFGRAEHPFDTVKKLVEDQKLIGKELRHKIEEEVTHQMRISFSSEQLPDPENRVGLSLQTDGLGLPRPELKYAIDAYSREGMAYAKGVVKEIFVALGVDPDAWNFNLDPSFFTGSGHIMGTCRMGADPKDSVVDANCRSHDHKNLFVLGSAVFPTGGTANPTLTVAALALRAAKTIGEDVEALKPRVPAG